MILHAFRTLGQRAGHRHALIEGVVASTFLGRTAAAYRYCKTSSSGLERLLGDRTPPKGRQRHHRALRGLASHLPFAALCRSSRRPLSLRFKHEGVLRWVLYPSQNPLAFALFADSGSLFDRRVAFRSATEAAFGPPGRPTAGFRRLRRRAHFHQKRRNHPVDPYGRQPTRVVTTLPWQTQVRNTGARQP